MFSPASCPCLTSVFWDCEELFLLHKFLFKWQNNDKLEAFQNCSFLLKSLRMNDIKLNILTGLDWKLRWNEAGRSRNFFCENFVWAQLYLCPATPKFSDCSDSGCCWLVKFWFRIYQGIGLVVVDPDTFKHSSSFWQLWTQMWRSLSGWWMWRCLANTFDKSALLMSLLCSSPLLGALNPNSPW